MRTEQEREPGPFAIICACAVLSKWEPIHSSVGRGLRGVGSEGWEMGMRDRNSTA